MSGASRERRGRWRRVLGLLPYAILLVVVPTPASAPLTQLNSNQHADNADNSEGCTLCYSRDAALGLGRHGKPTVPPALCSEGNCARDDDDGFNGDLGIAGNGDLNKDDINSEASENSSHDLVSGVVGGTEELLGLKSEFAEKENESDLTPGPRTTLGLSKPLLLSGHQGTQIASPGDHGGDDSLLVRASNEAAPHHNYEGIIRSIQARRKVSQVSEPPGDLPHVSGRYPLRPPGDNTTRDSRMEGTQGGHSKHTKETQGGQSNHMDDTQRRRSHMLSKQNYLGTNKQRSRGRETDSSLERQQRVVRRAEKTQQPQDSAAQPAEMRPANCTSAPSCSGQQPALGARYPCSCDAHCHVYGDCCQGVQTPLHQTTPTTLSPSFFTCSSLTPSAHRMWATPKMVYMVGRCPAETEPQLAAKCARTAPATYLMDIPVFSNASGVVYSNVYCSKCHHDFRIERMNVSITCSLNITSAAELANMTYHPGQLRWTLANSEGEEVPSGIPVLHSQPSMSCLLDVNYPETVGRRCEETVNSCKVDWPDKENWQRCSSYNYYVEVNDIVYKNWDCAICNEEEEGDIQCLYKYPIIDDLDLRIFAQPPSLIDLFIIDGECEDSQVWDILHHRCEDVSCGFLFTLVDGKCLRNNKTVDGRPYLNISCYTRDFNRDYSVMFPNQSIYLNHTEKTYDLGEYEFNSSWIRVCRPEGRWTPVMNKISAVLISISLSGGTVLKVAETSVQEHRDFAFYKVELKDALQPGKTVNVEVEIILTQMLEPYPATIQQGEKQLVRYAGNHYVLTPYTTTTQTTTVTLPSPNIESYSRLKPTTHTDTSITYGPYDGVTGFSEDPMNVHYENNAPFLCVTRLERVIELSHWGNIAVEETIDVLHIGAKLKGPFSRYDYQREHNSYSSIKSFKTIMPASAKDVYYRDEIGNISTSHMRVQDDAVELDLRPRFPLFGGWKTHYKIGYNVPSYEYLYSSGDQYILKMRILDHVFDDFTVDELVLKVILPEGVRNIVLETPYPVERLPDSLHFTYLDTVGRPVVTLTKRNLVESHIQDLTLHYQFPAILMLQEPLLVVIAFFILFITVIFYVRLDLTLSKDDAMEAKMRVSSYCEQVHTHHDKRARLYEKLEEELQKLKVSKDVAQSQAATKKIQSSIRDETQAITEIGVKIRVDNAEYAEKVSELQKLDKVLRESVLQQLTNVEKLVVGKMSKQQYMDADTPLHKKKEEALEKIKSILGNI